jgi:hypothetical protein
MDPEIHHAAQRAAALEGVSLAEYIRQLLQRNLEGEASGEGCVEDGVKRNGEAPRIP